MNHVIAIGMKFIAVTAVLWIVLSVASGILSMGDILIMSAVITLLSYAGDMTLMPKISNITASIVDMAAVFVLIWVLGIWLGSNSSELIWGAVIAAVIIGVTEYFYHIYLKRNILTKHTWNSDLVDNKD